MSEDHEKQVAWIIEQLEEIKSKSEKAKLMGFNKDSQQNMMRTTKYQH